MDRKQRIERIKRIAKIKEAMGNKEHSRSSRTTSARARSNCNRGSYNGSCTRSYLSHG